MRPRLLDLCCKAGGSAMGYYRAGFEVVGVDLEPQRHYPFEFHRGDALTYRLDGFDAIHASPPCQSYTPLRALQGGKEYPDILAAVRARLIASGVPWVIENVPGAPLNYYVTLCGSMFGLRTYRHRRFETSWYVWQPEHPRHTVRTATKQRRAAWDAGLNVSITGDVGVYVGEQAMGITWMTGDELSEAIPPAYTEWLGVRLLAALGREAA